MARLAVPDRRLAREIAELGILLDAQPELAATTQARTFLDRASQALEHPWHGNEDGWAWYGAARRASFALLAPEALCLQEADLRHEAKVKTTDWRLDAIGACPTGDAAKRLARVRMIQQHLDRSFENDNRKRRLRRGQFVVYLGVLVVALGFTVALEFADKGLVLAAASEEPNGWWVVAVVLYGTLGGAFSAGQRVAARPSRGRYPELRWEQLTNAIRPLAGGTGALIAFAALQAGVLGDAGTFGPRVALVAFTAGFSERFIPSLTATQAPTK
jgi:hypothetical protein